MGKISSESQHRCQTRCVDQPFWLYDVAVYTGTCQTTIQVSNYYKNNRRELDLERIAANAPKRSPSPPMGNLLWLEQRFGLTTPTPTPRLAPHSGGRGSSPPPPPMSSLAFESNRNGPPLNSSSISILGYPPSLSRPPQKTQLPMARLGSGFADFGRSNIYNSPPSRNSSHPYVNPPDSGGGYALLPPKLSGLVSNRRLSDAASRDRQQRPYPGHAFGPRPPLVPPPVPTPSNGRSGYNGSNSNGNSNNTPATGPNVTPIIHSPTGMSPPLPPMQAVHPYFPPPHPHTASPHHNPYFPPTAPVMHHDPRVGPPLQNVSWPPPPPPPLKGPFERMEGYAERERRQREGGTRKREPNPYPVFDGPLTGSSSASTGVPRSPGSFSFSRHPQHYG
jgi:hypothetical protein